MIAKCAMKKTPFTAKPVKIAIVLRIKMMSTYVLLVIKKRVLSVMKP